MRPDPDIGSTATPRWEPLLIRIERAIARGDVATVRTVLPGFVALFRSRAAALLPPIGWRQAARSASAKPRSSPRRPAHAPAATGPSARDVPADQARPADGVEQPARRPARQQLRSTVPHGADRRGRDAPLRRGRLGRGRRPGWAALDHALPIWPTHSRSSGCSTASRSGCRCSNRSTTTTTGNRSAPS